MKRLLSIARLKITPNESTKRREDFSGGGTLENDYIPGNCASTYSTFLLLKGVIKIKKLFIYYITHLFSFLC